MEKKHSKLNLSKETLVTLDDQQLAGVAGGGALSIAVETVICNSGICQSGLICESAICNGINL